MTLQERLQLADVAALPDWAAASVLNAPDPTLPVITTWADTNIDPGTIMDILGATTGAQILNTLEQLSSSNAVVKWGMRVLEGRRGLNMALETSREQMQSFVDSGLITIEQRDLLYNLSKRERYPSWAEANGINVTARSVGLARGAK